MGWRLVGGIAMKIHELNNYDRIIIWQEDDQEEGRCGTVIQLFRQNFDTHAAYVLLDGTTEQTIITNDDYFDKLPISFKKGDRNGIQSI